MKLKADLPFGGMSTIFIIEVTLEMKRYVAAPVDFEEVLNHP